ncbi:hypothetical protein ACF3NA_02125 [Alkanindiges sp. WGS2144]|uniref:hypothetical protein n=1 Tax=Alkanindiges sp. WGS2144 TaxID=3366808 RepID=UPI003752663D
MNRFYKNSKSPFALTTLCLLLSACGGESNTFNEGSGSTGGGQGNGSMTLLCPSDDLSCVDVVFDDTPVVNLNYECGKYNGVTDATGTARCPIDSNVKFYLKAANGVRRVNLGTFSIKSVRNNDPSEAQDTSLIRIGVKELAENTTGASINNLDDSATATAAINISRLLQSLRRKSEPYVETAPVNRVYIDNAVKADIEKISQNVEPKDFLDDTFEEKLAPWLEAQKRTLLDEGVAKARLEKTILATKSGIFFSTPTATLDWGMQIGSLNLDLGISGSNANNQRASVAVYMLTDRTGQTTGYGMQWTGQTTTAQDAYKLFLTSNFAKMRINNASGSIDPYTDRFNKLGFKVGPKTYEANDANQYSGDTFSFNNGKLIRDLAVFGSADVYEFFTRVKIADQTELGTWEQKTPTGSTSFTGNATVFKTGAINSYFDPAVWRTKDSITAGNYIFPLYATFTFSYDDAYLEECKKQALTCAKSDQLPVVFLENGDIMTDGDNADLLVNSKAVCGQGNIPQTRIGTVRAAYTSTDGNQAYINPSVILSGDQFGALDGIQIGTSALAPRVKINIAGIKQAATGQQGSINVTSAEGGDTASGNAPGVWVNGFNSFTGFRVAQKEAEDAAEEKPEKPSPAITKAQKLASEQVAGNLAASVSSCYTVKQK